jgi:chromosome segregation ATPase
MISDVMREYLSKILSYNLIQERSNNKFKELQVNIRNLIAIKTSLEDLSANDAKLIKALETENTTLRTKIELKEYDYFKALNTVSELQQEKDKLIQELKNIRNIKDSSSNSKKIEELKRINKDLKVKLIKAEQNTIRIKKLEDEVIEKQEESKQLRADLEHVNDKLKKVLEESGKQILELRDKCNSLDQQLTESNQLLATNEIIFKVQYAKAVNELKVNKEESSKALNDIESRLNVLKSENEELKVKHESDMKASNKEISELLKEVNDLEDKIKENESAYNKQVNELIKQAEEQSKLKKEYEDKLRESEDVCNKTIKDLKVELQELREDNKKIKQEMHSIELEAQSIQEEHKKQQKEAIDKHETKCTELKTQHERIVEASNKQIKELTQKLKDIEEKSNKQLTIKELGDKIDTNNNKEDTLHSSELGICFSELNSSKSEQIPFDFSNDTEKLKEMEKTKEMFKAKYLEKIEELKRLKTKAEKLWQDVEKRNKRKHELGVKAMQRLEEEILKLQNENKEIAIKYKEVLMEYNKVKNQNATLCHKIDFLESRCKHLNEQIIPRCEQNLLTISQSEYESYMQRIRHLEKEWEKSKEQLIKKEHQSQEEYARVYDEALILKNTLINTRSELNSKEQQIEMLRKQLEQTERMKLW